MQTTTRLAQGVLERAFIGDSLLNECVEGAVDAQRIWWVQADAMVGMANLWQKTGDPALLRNMQELWNYIQKYILDPRQGGEWYAAADPQGKPVRQPIAEPWKAPYHNERTCMEMMKRL